ncbi:MAG: cytochrome P450 [Bdellovibrionota bacterium]
MKRLSVLAVLFIAACTSTPHRSSGPTQTQWKEVNFPSSTLRRPSSNVDYIREIESAAGKKIAKPIATDAVLDAKARMEKIFEFARNEPNTFFAQMRRERPIFSAPGAVGKVLGKDVAIPTIYLVTRYSDVLQVLDQNTKFTVKPYAKIMTATVGSPYMLGNDNTAANAEKPGMRHSLYGRNDLNKVRRIVRQIAQRTIKENAKNGTIDIAKHVGRAVPLGLNDEYFGFNPPNPEAMARWSKATQYAFFHNPFKDKDVEKDSIQAGNEMREYITNVLVPARTTELANGRPANDTVSQILKASKAHAKHGLQGERIIANIIGLLVGSVETTTAAINQSIQVLMENPDIMNEAIRAAQRGDEETFSKIVWEALRFDPVNPWLARYAEEDVTIAAGTDRETVIKKGSLVLASTQSAMWDEEVFPQPDSFNIDRDQSKFMHLGYGYHRCLGDDISKVMVPETVKQILLLDGIRKVDATSVIDQKGGPFPESYVLAFNPSAVAPIAPADAEEGKDENKILDGLGLGKYVITRITKMEKRDEALFSIRKVLTGNTLEKRKAIYDLPLLVDNAMKDFTPAEKIDACLNKNPRSKEAFPNVVDRQNYCSIRIDFRGCYFVHRLLAKQSAYASYYHCAYGRNFLTPAERAQFKQNFAHLDNFYFLGLE